jgi:DNA-binding NarL/FixJ family response regulator
MCLGSFYPKIMAMTRVYVADAKPEERFALRLLLHDLKMQAIGETADWTTLLSEVPVRNTEILVVDWDLLPAASTAALGELRKACPAALVVVLINRLNARQQAAVSAGADAFISKVESPERVAERLLIVAASAPSYTD